MGETNEKGTTGHGTVMPFRWSGFAGGDQSPASPGWVIFIVL